MYYGKVRLSSKRQVVIPAEIVRRLQVKPGAEFIVQLTGNKVILTPEPESYTQAFAGLLRGVYGDEREVREYLREERSSWNKQRTTGN